MNQQQRTIDSSDSPLAKGRPPLLPPLSPPPLSLERAERDRADATAPSKAAGASPSEMLLPPLLSPSFQYPPVYPPAGAACTEVEDDAAAAAASPPRARLLFLRCRPSFSLPPPPPPPPPPLLLLEVEAAACRYRQKAGVVGGGAGVRLTD